MHPRISQYQPNKSVFLLHHTVLWRSAACGGSALHGQSGTEAPSIEWLCLSLRLILFMGQARKGTYYITLFTFYWPELREKASPNCKMYAPRKKTTKIVTRILTRMSSLCGNAPTQEGEGKGLSKPNKKRVLSLPYLETHQ